MDDVDRFFDALRPRCEEITRAIRHAPLGSNDRAGLAFMAAAHFFGTACGALQDHLDPQSEAMDRTLIRKVADVIVGMLEKPEARDRQ